MKRRENNDEGFGMPDGYFRDSARRLEARIGWEEELRAYPGLSAARALPFTVPDDYFSKSAAHLASDAVISDRLQNPFSIPDNYFDQSADSVRREIETENIVSALKQRNAAQPFNVPDGFFTESETRIRRLLQPPPAARVRSLWFRAAAAAALAVFAALLLIPRGSVDENDCGGIACLDKSELIHTRIIDHAESYELYDLVNPRELEQNLGAPGEGGGNGNSGSDTSEELLEIYPEDI